MTKSLPKLSTQILEEASVWFIDFNEGDVDRARLEEFDAWLRRSPEHVRAFLQISVFWEDAGMLSKRPELDVDGLIARAQAEHNVRPLEIPVRNRTQNGLSTLEPNTAAEQVEKFPYWGRGTKRRWLAIAASIVGSLGTGALIWYATDSASTFATEVGEQRSITLSDGSSVELNSRSRIKVRFTEMQRSVDLLEGQALFTVAKDSTRPFVVATGDTRVRAVGTQFDVYRKRAGTVVTVVEGRVAIAPSRERPRQESMTRVDEATSAVTESGDVTNGRGSSHLRGKELGANPGEVLLGAGEQMLITPAAIELSKPANVAVATAWTDKRLVFDSTPLREVVEEFNRYNRQQLVIRDPELYDFHISGVFPSTDSARMVEFLRQRFGVTMNRSRDEIQISRRDPGEMPRDAASL